MVLVNVVLQCLSIDHMRTLNTPPDHARREPLVEHVLLEDCGGLGAVVGHVQVVASR